MDFNSIGRKYESDFISAIILLGISPESLYSNNFFFSQEKKWLIHEVPWNIVTVRIWRTYII